MIDVFLLSFATFYLVEILLISPRSPGRGLFESEKKVYLAEKGEQIFWFENFFDRLRGAMVYKMYSLAEDGNVYINIKRASVFMCPICLSFWLSALVNFLWWVPQGDIKMFVISTLCVSGVSSFLHTYLTKGEYDVSD